VNKWLSDFKAKSMSRRVLVKLSLRPEYVVSASDRKAKNQDGTPSASQKDSALTHWILTQVFRSKYPATPEQQARGIFIGAIKDKDAKKIVGRLQNTLQTAVNKDADWIEIDLTQIEWLHDAVEAWEVSSDWAGWRLTLLEHLDETIKRASDKNGGDAEPSEKNSGKKVKV
jgi:hypothetical protein